MKCSKCNDNYGFNGTDRSTCLSIETNLSHYYTKDHGYSYFPCSEENSNCTGCYYEVKEENNIGVHCYQCTGNMILLNKQRGLCVEKQDLENKTRYYFINETHAGDCSVTFENCISCDNDIFCSKCKYGYGYSGEYGKCVPKEMIKKVVIASDGTTTYEEVKKNDPIKDSQRSDKPDEIDKSTNTALEFIYNDEQQRAVIDTIYKGFPLNSMYWALNEDGTYEVIDGQQRTISFCEFIDGNFSTILENSLNYFNNFNETVQNRILDYECTIYICEGNEQ